MRKHFDIAIIGAGPSGMAAALEARLEGAGLRILLIEKNAEPGRKLRATGSGRCNISNEAAPGCREALDFLRRQGIAVRTYPNGLIYPYSESASDVTELLAARVREAGIGLWTESSVSDIYPVEYPGGTGYRVTIARKGTDPDVVDCRRLIVASGGKSGPNYGTTGDAYAMLRRLGHTLVRPIPVLTPVECAEDGCEEVSGTRAKGVVTLIRHHQGFSEEVFSEAGEIQFTRFGLSGICVFNMTRHMRFSRDEGIESFEIRVDLCPDLDMTGFLRERRGQEQTFTGKDRIRAGLLLCSVLREKLADYVLKRSGIDAGRPIAELSDAELTRVADNVHSLLFRPTGIRGWKEAQCTSGGIPLTEIDRDTCESKCCPGLYITGELQDYDGPCGGFNLTHAWCTGMAAGRAAAESLR